MNQYNSRKTHLRFLLKVARDCLNEGDFDRARAFIWLWRKNYDAAPGSTKRRWRAGL